jgi:hypothetical protein
MSVGCFTDKQKTPQQNEVKTAIGACFPLWQELITHIQDTYTPREEFKFLYGRNYGWGIRFQAKSKLLACLYPTSGYFTVQIILNPAEVEAVRSMDPGEGVVRAIDAATPYPEGRWLFIPVESQAGLEDIKKIIHLHGSTGQR